MGWLMGRTVREVGRSHPPERRWMDPSVLGPGRSDVGLARNEGTHSKEEAMEQEARPEEGVSRRKFLQLGGLLGLALGGLSLPSLGWGEEAARASESAQEDERLVRRRRRRRKGKAARRARGRATRSAEAAGEQTSEMDHPEA